MTREGLSVNDTSTSENIIFPLPFSNLLRTLSCMIVICCPATAGGFCFLLLNDPPNDTSY